MNKKVLLPASLAIILIVAISVLVTRKGGDSAQVSSGTNSTGAAPTLQEDVTKPSTIAENPAPSPAPATPTTQTPLSGEITGKFSSGESDAEGNDVQVFNITYDGNGYTPNTLTVKQGDIVVFKNKSSQDFWPASSPHPMHTDYPEFDPKKPVVAGASYQFKFAKAGTWKFHDHLNSGARGVITVNP